MTTTEHRVTARDGVTLHAEETGSGPAIVFANSLGTNLHLWDAMLPHLTPGLRVIRYDKRGHGKSDVPDAPYTMGQLVSDAEAVCDALNVRDALFVGLSVGGMIAQGLAVKRPEIMRAMVLSNTAAKIGNPKLWDDRINAIAAKGDVDLVFIGDSITHGWEREGAATWKTSYGQRKAANFGIDHDSIDEIAQVCRCSHHDRITDGYNRRGFVVRHRLLLLRASGDDHDCDHCDGGEQPPDHATY